MTLLLFSGEMYGIPWYILAIIVDYLKSVCVKNASLPGMMWVSQKLKNVKHIAHNGPISLKNA